MKIFFTRCIFFLCISVAHGQQKGILPDFGVVQYAGINGKVSMGIGYDILKSQARFSTHFGIIPANSGGTLNVVSAKLYFKTASFTVWNRVRINPFDIGIMGSYFYGNKFEEKWPEGVHPKGYYWWNPAFQMHFGMESAVTYEFKKGHRLRAATGYIEFNTNELYFVSFIQNFKAVSLRDIVKVGTGVRVHF